MTREAENKGQAISTAPQRVKWVASVAGSWALLFAGIHFYWALGGPAGFAAASGNINLQHQFWFVVLGLWGVGSLCILAGGLAFALVRPWSRIIPRWIPLAIVWIAGAVFALRGIAVEIQDLLVVTHLVVLPVPVHWEIISWRLLLWSPWFLLGGLLFCITAWWNRHTAKEALHHDDEHRTH